MTTVPIDSIWVDRSTRQRKEITPGAIAKLADSIQRVGRIIHPPVIERDGRLIVGETRWEAAKHLGYTSIDITYADDLDDIQRQLLEYEENVGRTDLPWRDECLAVLGFHNLHLELDPEWTFAKTAEALGVSPATISDKVSVARELSRGQNILVKDAPKYSTAKGIVARQAERKQQSVMTGIATLANPEGPVAQQEVARAENRVPLLRADFHEWAAAYTGPRKFNLIHCDFPYGVGADKHDQGQAKSQGGYADDFATYDALVTTLNLAMSSVVADSAHLVFWFSMDYYTWTKTRLEDMGWAVNPFPLVWTKNDGTGILPDPARGPRRGYETAFLASRGDRKIIRAKANWFAHPGKDKDIHMSEKPVPMLKHFMEMLTDDTTVLLDPTAGSANALKAGTALGANSVLGLEQNEEFYNRAREAYFDE